MIFFPDLSYRFLVIVKKNIQIDDNTKANDYGVFRGCC